MIYLIESFMRGGDDHPLRCLKIGYAKDINDRMKVYKTYNPSVKLLKTREGDYDLENYLHKYFKRYELSDFNEWFIYSKKIIEEFELIEISWNNEYIRTEIINKIIPREYEKTFSKIPSLLCKLEKDFNEGMFMDNIYSEFPKDLCKKKIEDVLNFLKNQEIDYYKTVDFPQDLKELGLIENPWKNRAEMYFKALSKKNLMNQEDFDKIIQEKLKHTEDRLKIYEGTEPSLKHILAQDYKDRAKSLNYANDYISVNLHSGKTLVPIINNLVLVSELRAFEIQQVDYKDRFSVFNTIMTATSSEIIMNSLTDTLSKFDMLSHFTDKMRFLCDLSLDEEDLQLILELVPLVYKNYLQILGKEKIKSLGYQKSKLEFEYERLKLNQAGKITLEMELIRTFEVGKKYGYKFIKSELEKLYSNCNISSTAKATDLEKYFNVKIVKVNDPDNPGKRINGYEIISLK